MDYEKKIMDIRKIIREEVDDFDWIRDIPSSLTAEMLIPGRDYRITNEVLDCDGIFPYDMGDTPVIEGTFIKMGYVDDILDTGCEYTSIHNGVLFNLDTYEGHNAQNQKGCYEHECWWINPNTVSFKLLGE